MNNAVEEARGKRLGYIDIARAFAIICVIAGHTFPTQSVVHDFCFTFELPLFFFVSGYFSHSDARLTKSFVWKSLKSLMLPYAVTCLLLILFSGVHGAVLPTESSRDSMSSFILASLYGVGETSDTWPARFFPSIGAIWFLPALFFVRMLLAAIDCVPNRKWRALCVVAAFALGYLSRPYIWLPMSIQPALVSLPFAWAGQEFRDHDLLTRLVASQRRFIWPALFAAFGLCVWLGGHMYLNAVVFGDGVFIGLLGGLSGTLCVFGASEFLNKRFGRVLAPLWFIGRSTLPIFCMHLIEMKLSLCGVLLAVTGVQNSSGALFVARLCVTALMCGCLWVVPFLKRVYFPHSEGYLPGVLGCSNN